MLFSLHKELYFMCGVKNTSKYTEPEYNHVWKAGVRSEMQYRWVNLQVSQTSEASHPKYKMRKMFILYPILKIH